LFELLLHVGGGFFEFSQGFANGAGDVGQAFAAEQQQTYNEDEHHLHTSYAI
jgi:hypothetical protein